MSVMIIIMCLPYVCALLLVLMNIITSCKRPTYSIPIWVSIVVCHKEAEVGLREVACVQPLPLLSCGAALPAAWHAEPPVAAPELPFCDPDDAT